MSSGQAWWADHEESLEHIRGECSCDLAFRERCGMAPPLPNAPEMRDRLAQERSEKNRRIAELRSELRKLEAL